MQQILIRTGMARPTLAFLALLIFSAATWADVSAAPESGPAPPAAASESESESEPEPAIEDYIDELKRKLEGALQEIEIVSQATAQGLPAGITASDLEKYQELLRSLVFWIDVDIKHAEGLRVLRSSRADFRNERLAWQGFSEPPPYPIAVPDQIREEIYTELGASKTVGMRLEATISILNDSRAALAAAETLLRQANERLERARRPEDKARELWLRDRAALSHRVALAEVSASENRRQFLDETSKHVQEKLDFLRRKAQLASDFAVFTKAELDEKLAQIAAQREAVMADLTLAKQNDYELKADLARLEDEEEKARLPSVTVDLAGERRDDSLPGIIRLRRAQAETASISINMLQLSEYLLGREKIVWEQRFELANSRDSVEIARAEKQIRELRERAETWKNSLSAELLVDLRRLASQASRSADAQPNAALGQELLETYRKRVALRQATLERFERAKTLAFNWEEELHGRRSALSWLERAESAGRAVGDLSIRMWDAELFTIEDSVVVDGETVSGKRSITVGKITLVLLVIAAGFWLVQRLSGLMQRIAAAGVHGDLIRGLLVYRLSYLVLLVALIITALTMVNIPLTAFAFLGGTVAIALGFGGQNLANNFISGLILMIERPISIGDLVELDGVRGRVLTIGARSCHIRRADGIETLVPNSSLLEKSVTNLTFSDQQMRVSVRVGVSYGTSTRETERLIAQAIDEHPLVLKSPVPRILFEDFGDNALIFEAYFWVEISEQVDYRIAVSDIRHRIDELLRDAGIGIAFPQRDVHLTSSGPFQVEITAAPSQISKV